MDYTNIINFLRRLDATTNKIYDYSIESISCQHVVWWNQMTGITQHFFFNKDGRLDNLIII